MTGDPKLPGEEMLNWSVMQSPMAWPEPDVVAVSGSTAVPSKGPEMSNV